MIIYILSLLDSHGYLKYFVIFDATDIHKYIYSFIYQILIENL